jgi:hypothetical protein
VDERLQMLEAQMASEACRVQQLQQQLLAQHTDVVEPVPAESAMRFRAKAPQRSNAKLTAAAGDRATLRNPGRIRPLNHVSKLSRKHIAAAAAADASPTAYHSSSTATAVSDSGAAILRAHLVHDYLVSKQQRSQKGSTLTHSSSSKKRRSVDRTAAARDDSNTLQQQCDFTEACLMTEALWSQLGVPQRDRALFRTLHFAAATFENMLQVNKVIPDQ